MRTFDYERVINMSGIGKLINMISYIDSIKKESNILIKNYSAAFSELEKIAKVESIKSSNEIEGIITSDERILSIINGDKPLNHSESAILGYRDALNLIHLNYSKLNFSEETILLLHEVLMSHISKLGGVYKQSDNLIVEVKNNIRSVRFKPVSKEETKEAMEQLVLAYLDARDNLHIHPLILIPSVILDFLCIHPFSDGNGRISRLLTLLLLYQEGYMVGKYISIEEQLNLNKNYYYESLKESSTKWDLGENDYLPIITNFLNTLYSCYKELEKRFGTVNAKKISKNKRIEQVLLTSLTPLAKKDIAYMLPDISITTIEQVLTKLVKEEKIEKLGSGKNTKYFRILH